MSEEKLYAVKNDEGEWLDQDRLWGPGTWATPDKDEREKVAKCYGGHVVTFVEEPEKVVLTKEQAEIVEKARVSDISATYISARTDEYNGEESLLMEAFVNGYTLANEKKYNVKVPYAEGWHFQKYSSASKLGPRNDWKPFPAKDIDSNMSKELFQFTETEIEHYGLQDCEKEEVTDDD
ncbi:DUF1642 domain-containing protein [Lacticaseibacillus paracasei]|uniref:DUF1642 domain-containing protein n=1 Tax=Lacticaseibacillus paracasei TaxID=1597 RepID=UPI0031F624AE